MYSYRRLALSRWQEDSVRVRVRWRGHIMGVGGCGMAAGGLMRGDVGWIVVLFGMLLFWLVFGILIIQSLRDLGRLGLGLDGVQRRLDDNRRLRFNIGMFLDFPLGRLLGRLWGGLERGGGDRGLEGVLLIHFRCFVNNRLRESLVRLSNLFFYDQSDIMDIDFRWTGRCEGGLITTLLLWLSLRPGRFVPLPDAAELLVKVEGWVKGRLLALDMIMARGLSLERVVKRHNEGAIVRPLSSWPISIYSQMVQFHEFFR